MKLTKAKILKIISITVSIMVASLGLFFKIDGDLGLLLNDSIKFLPLIMLICLTILLIVELFFAKSYGRAIYMFIALSTSISLYSSGLSIMNAGIWFLSLIYLILTIFSLIKGKEREGLSKLPEGILTVKQAIILYGVLLLLVILAIVYLFIWVNLFNKKMITAIIIMFIVLFVLFIPLVFFTNPLRKIVNKYNKDLNFNDFYNSINKLLSNNLSDDTRIYLMLVLSNYMYYKNKEEGIRLFNSLNRPKSKNYARVYDQFAVTNAIFEDDNELIYKRIEDLSLDPKNIQLVKQAERFITLYKTNEYIDNIEKLYPINTVNNYMNLVNEFNLMWYYDTRGYNDKALEIAKRIISYNLDLDYMNDVSNKIINKNV